MFYELNKYDHAVYNVTADHVTVYELSTMFSYIMLPSTPINILIANLIEIFCGGNSVKKGSFPLSLQNLLTLP